MLIRRAEDVTARAMDMPGASGVNMKLMVGREHGAPTFAMRLFEVAPGGHTPLHEHNYEHEIVILEGAGTLGGAAEGRAIRAGDVLLVPANETHQLRNSGPEPLKFICLVPTQFDCGQGQCSPTPGS